MHEVRRMIATLCEIFMSELCSIKSLFYASVIARAFNRVAGNIVHFQGSTKVPSGRPGQVDFEVGQVTFQGHLPDGQALGPTLHRFTF